MRRRDFLAGAVAGLTLGPVAAGAETILRSIGSSGHRIPAIGMGTWITFDVGADLAARSVRVEVLRRFLAAGGAVIDSSPMYGSAQAVIGHCLEALESPDCFSATKVWVPGRERGIHQMGASADLWGVERFDLMQVHNLVDWRTHLETLFEWRETGRVRFVGVTTSHGRRHAELERIMETQPLDFVQFTYNIADREAESRLLPLAAERGLGVIVNRPFRTGGLFRIVGDRPLPPLAGEIGCENWAQFFLKFIIAHPAVTCAIPATSRVRHMDQNMAALRGPLPDEAQRRRMVEAFQA